MATKASAATAAPAATPKPKKVRPTHLRNVGTGEVLSGEVTDDVLAAIEAGDDVYAQCVNGTWVLIDVTELPPGPLPGEYRKVGV